MSLVAAEINPAFTMLPLAEARSMPLAACNTGTGPDPLLSVFMMAPPAVSDAGGSVSERLSHAPDKQVTHGVVEGESRGQ